MKSDYNSRANQISRNKSCCYCVVASMLLVGSIFMIAGFTAYTNSNNEAFYERTMLLSNQTAQGEYLNGQLCQSKFCYAATCKNARCNIVSATRPYTLEYHIVFHQGNAPVFDNCTMRKQQTHDDMLAMGIIGVILFVIACVSLCMNRYVGCKC